ncbi:MAG: glutamate--tRNA ligase [Planctomycetes bacterium]|nr:glutamate--tRNA ligase [Planctomycetota bacterium]
MAVTRFAPSPTGYLHIGGARTALFNWLLARKSGGKFILRIEDTDTKRNTPTATEQVKKDLSWLGINWDEGPGIGGENEPYLQSQRRGIYDKYMAKLLAEKKAYYCFETAEELNALRKQAEIAKRNFTYPRPEIFPNDSDVKKAEAAGKPAVIRFAMPFEEIIVSDVIRGEVRFAAGEMGDFVIQKSDSFPTYHFACVVDDELMGVTHIIRGQEHLNNTPCHQALQDSLGFSRPIYAHMSVTISQTGGKLSKRERPKALRNAIKAKAEIDIEKLAKAAGITTDEINEFIAGKTIPDMPAIDAMAEFLGVVLPEINVIDFFRNGYLPETMVNFMALLGWNPGGDKEIMPLEELLDCFDISRFSKSNSLFDRDKLISFNTEYIRTISKEKLLAHFKSYLCEIDSVANKANDVLLAKILEICEGARTLADIERKCRFLFLQNDKIEYDPKAVKKILLKNDGLAILQIIAGKIEAMQEISAEKIENMLRNMAEEKQLGLGKIAQPLRVAICGNTISPPIFESVNMLGKENTLARIDITLRTFEGKAHG